MTKCNLKKLILFITLFSAFDVHGKTANILKLSCEYDPNLIKKETKNIDSLKLEKLNFFQKT